MSEIPFRPDANQPPNQPNQNGTPYTAREHPQPPNKGIFGQLREKLRHIGKRDQIPKPLKVKLFDPEWSPKFAQMNRIVDLPVEHQRSALALVYEEAESKGRRSRRSGWEEVLGPHMRRLEVDKFACEIETDPALKLIAQATVESHEAAFKKSLEVQDGNLSVGQPYESVDAASFSPQVVQSREVCLTILEALSSYSDSFIISQLGEFDHSGLFSTIL